MSCVASLRAEQSLDEDSSFDSSASTDRQTERQTDTICIHRCLLFSGAPIHFLSDRFTSLHAVQLPSVCDCRASLSHHCTPCTSQQRDGRKEEEEAEREREQAGTFFRGPVIYYLISQELLNYKSKVCQRENNKTQTQAAHSSLHQEKSHPRAEPATVLGPLILFCIVISPWALLVGFIKNSYMTFQRIVPHGSERASFSIAASSRRI